MAKLGSYIRTPETNLINDLEQYNMKLKDKVEQLQDRIDSAINYIEKIKEEYVLRYSDGIKFEDLEEVNKLLDILKGE